MNTLHSAPDFDKTEGTLQNHYSKHALAGVLGGAVLGVSALVGLAHTSYAEGTPIDQGVHSVEQSLYDVATSSNLDFRTTGTR